MSVSDRYDVIIIGTGAGGGTLLHRLAPTGKRILVIERGDFLPREKENWDPEQVFVRSRYKAHETWLDGSGAKFHPGIHYYVGGNTKVYGAALVRFRERDFTALRHQDGVSPAWPIRYSDLEAYYTQAEHLYQVRGVRGEDPTDPPASAPYRYSPIEHEPRIQQLSDDLERLGHHPFHLPMAVKRNGNGAARSQCIRCSTCDGYPCLVDAKCDAQVIAVDPSLAYPNVTLWTNTRAVRIETNSSGRMATGVVVERDGETSSVAGDFVVVSCGAINSAALLLASANDKHPHGLGNSSGQVGRNYMCHNNSVLLAISKKPNPTVFQKTIGLNDFYFGADDFDFPLGHISMVGKSDRAILSAEAPSFAPGFALDRMAKHSLDFWLTSEDLPDPENRVTLTAAGQVMLHYRENNVEAHKRLVAKLKSMLKGIGCDQSLLPRQIYLGRKIGLAGTAHQCGTLKFGTDPKQSVLDTNCRMHDLDNLYAVDGSFFVSSTAVNPALTIMANALRVGDHLRARMS